MVAARQALLAGLIVLSLSACAAPPDPWAASYSSLDTRSLQDAAQKVVDCLSSKGFPGATATSDGGVIGASIPSDQLVLYREAEKTCAASEQSTVAGDTKTPQKRELYQLELQAAKCLAKHGLNPSTPPSEQTYIDSYGTGLHWTAWGSVANQSGAQSVSSKCPDPNWFVGALPTPPK